MKKKEGQQEQTLKGPVSLVRRDFSGMSRKQLLREGHNTYLALQALWCVELSLSQPDWEIMASVSRQLKILEERCPEICQ